ncbi:programmed cell death 6-interacting protein [Geosmithia morbida]|uniref:Programmed cell death 6-interacting protein n=1 Tax=Geosmithia morbida TaxID=1094350 RepID=A0A9P5D175_9HYPO|nr:programmed cell death 6-interacting protein [Geosmithia morbida]KAF4119570.1 programmed cell death 6-interacting protein [Geosmithia morbida]
MFKRDLEIIDDLRRDAVNVREPHTSGIAKLMKYAAQLVWIGGKFPIDIGAEFSWYPALGYNTEQPLVRNNLKFELLNILYNLASLYSQLAYHTHSGNGTNADALKTAANYFSLAAGVLTHMQTTVLPELRMSDPPEDMDACTLGSLTNLMLAQSQECFWQKAVTDGYKDASIAKLATRVSDLYHLAGESATKSHAVSTAWIHHVTAKHHRFAAAAQYRAACSCLERGKFGEEVARLRDALDCINEGLKEAKIKGIGIAQNKIVLDDLTGLKRKVEEDLKRAEKDNDIIYLNYVPPKSELQILERANMAIARTPPEVADPYKFLGDKAELGPALFSRLVPFSVHVAISIYEERRDRMVNQQIIQQLETLTERIHTLFESLGLPGSLQAIEKPIGLPQSLVQHAEDIRQADAIQRVRRSFVDIDKLRAVDVAIFEEGKMALASEEEEDQRLRTKYGTDRWMRPDSQSDVQGVELRGVAAEIEGYLGSSMSSDGVVRDKFASIEDLLRVLSGSDRSLMDYVPSSRRTETSDEVKEAVAKLRSAYSDVLRLESRRRKKIETLRDNVRRDDIKPDMLKEAARLERTYPTTPLVPAHFEDLFDKRLDKLYEPEMQALSREEEEQEKALDAVERANREFETAKSRRNTSQSSRERESALQRLDTAYFKYKDVVNNLEVARKFYNDLNKIVGQGFRDRVKQWVASRHMEARSLEQEISMPPLANLNINSHVPSLSSQTLAPQQHQQSPQYGTPQPEASNIQSWGGPGAAGPAPDHVQQPRPMQPQTWKPNMGIRFSGTGPMSTANAAVPDQAQQQQPSQQPNLQGQQPATWNPSSGLRFG